MRLNSFVRTRSRSWMWQLAVAGLLSCLPGPSVSADALQKLQPEKLAAVRKSVAALRNDRSELQRTGPYREFRANLHVHSHWSHDSIATQDEILAAAKAVGTSVLMFTEHPAEHFDFFVDGNQGLKDGVLMIPGAEMKGFLAYPRMSLRGIEPSTPQDLSDLIRGRDGQIFVSHPEERMDWDIKGVSGMEIYNTHADFKDEKGLMSALKNPFRLLQMAELFRQYPQESFAALQNYPADYLKRWDELCQFAPHVGVSANDSHQNIGIAVRWIEGTMGRVEDALGEKLIDLDLAFLPDIDNLKKDKQPGDIVFRVQLDPYETSLRHVGSHLLLEELSDNAVRECLDAGRLFVAFDWIADATGFDFCAVIGNSAESPARYEMGSTVSRAPQMHLKAIAPLPVQWRLIQNGTVVSESVGRSQEHRIEQSGVYRSEAWLEVAGEKTLWILSNPIYVTDP